MDANQEARRLHKSRSHRMIAGVCGGIAEYFSIDVTLVRLLWVLATIFGGWGLLVYIAAVLIMPSTPANAPDVSAVPPPAASRDSSSPFWGVLLIVVGVLLVAANLGVHVFFPWWGFSWKSGIGVLLIVAGVTVMFAKEWTSPGVQRNGATPSPDGSQPHEAPSVTRLKRSRQENVVFGVCGGIGAYLNLDPVIIRLLVVLAALGSFGLVLLMYLVLAAVLPLEDGMGNAAVAS